MVRKLLMMELLTIIEELQDRAESTNDIEDKVLYYRLSLYLDELDYFRQTYESERDYQLLDKATDNMIRAEIDKRGRI